LQATGLGPPKHEMAGNAYILSRSEGRHYEAVLRLSEALSVCPEPEDLTKILSEQLREFLAFLQFYIIVYKEDSTEVEWAVVGREKSLVAAYADVPVEQRPSWQAYTTQEPFYIRDWSTDERVPARLKQGIAAQGLDVGPLVFVPLTTPHRRLGALGMSGAPGTVYSGEDITFLRLIGRVVAFAIDDNFNLKRAEDAQRELQRQNERLQRSERELREVIETIPSMAWSAAADGAAEFFNGRWLAYAGLTADQAQGWGWTVAVHPDDLNLLVDYWRAVMASGRSGEIEARLRRSDGVYRWFLFRATPSLDDKGRVVKWYGTNTDIEERKRAEQALRRSEAYLAQAQKVAHIGSWVWEVAGRSALYLSEEWYRIYGFDPKDDMPTWKELLQQIHPEDRAKFQTTIDRAIKEKSEYDVEFRILPPHSTVKYIHSVGHPILSPSGELLQFVGVAMDVTERKRAEEEHEGLRQALAELGHINRVSMMGELTASLAHEIKQPMFAASTDAETCVRWLARDQPDLAEAQEAALRLMKDVSRASDIINRIVSLFKKEVPQRELIDVNGVVQEMVTLVRSEASRYSISIHAELTEGLPSIMADRVALQQVLMNLMLNAVEAMKEKGAPGKLTITTRRDDNRQIIVSVTDTGVGLPPGPVERIFDAFFTSKPQGTGMGLRISRSIIESHGGRLWASSNSGPGATFQFALPLEAAARQSA
jgi:PAS domain S-box-containing protein